MKKIATIGRLLLFAVIWVLGCALQAACLVFAIRQFEGKSLQYTIAMACVLVVFMDLFSTFLRRQIAKAGAKPEGA